MRRNTPAVGCDVFVHDTDFRVLLVQQRASGAWSLPGGAQDFGETPAQCAARECLEETGYQVLVTDLIGVFSTLNIDELPRGDLEYVSMLFFGEIVAGEPRLSDEISSIDWYYQTSLPKLSHGHLKRINV